MAPIRKQASRPGEEKSQSARDRQQEALLEFRNRRLQRKLDELERTNPTDIPASSFLPQSTSLLPLNASVNSNVGSGGSGAGGGMGGAAIKKKQSGNVRKILYAKKSLKDWLEELPSDPQPPYVSTTAPPPSTPARKLCSSCGYIGKYSCPKCGEYSCDMNCMDVHARDGGCGVGN